MTAKNSRWEMDRPILQLPAATQYDLRIHISYPFVMGTEFTWSRTLSAPVLVLMQISVRLQYKDALEGVRIQPETAFVRRVGNARKWAPQTGAAN
jgi:hypothetical protein